MIRAAGLTTLMVLLLPQSVSAGKATLELQKVTQDVYAVVGELGNRTPENLGNNATFGFVVTSDGIVLIDSGGTHDGAKALDAIIKTVSDKPVVKVINSGGQDHRWLGNAYFKDKGAEIISSEAAVKDQKARVRNQFFMLGNLVSDSAVRATHPVYADVTFERNYSFSLGGTQFEIRHTGQAHTPGDSYVWLPQKKVLFSGDIVYTERMLGIMDFSNSKSWVEVYQSMTTLDAIHLVPGHGHATNLETANKDTYTYLLDLRRGVSEFMENGGDISDISKVNQSKYKYLLNFDVLAGRNAQQVFMEMEWD